MSFILIKDILNNKDFIYNTQLIDGNNFDEAINYLKNTYNLDNVNFSIHDQFCEIFREQQILNKGWIWNSTESNKEVVFLLSLIPVLNIHNHNSKIEQVDTFTQTNFVTSQDISTQTEPFLEKKEKETQLELQYRYYNDQDRLFDHFETSLDIFPTHTNNTILIDPLNICNKTKVKQEVKILDVLTKELKSKLQLPNYGLKNTNYHFDLM